MAPKKSPAAAKGKSGGDIKSGSLVLYKIRGYPAWPGKIVDPETADAAVRKDKPRGNALCVRFYPKGDHAWAKASEMSLLSSEAISAYIAEPHHKNGELLQGYKIAADPSSWEADLERRMAEHAERMEGVDELEEEGEEEVGTASGAKKRKAGGAAGGKDAKGGKKAKVEKKPTKATTSKKAKSKANIESEDEAESAKPKAASKKAADDLDADSTKVKDWRHKLQRAFLGKLPPAEKDMPTCDQYFTTIEAYEDMTIEQLQTSKIGKVMRKIQALESIPRDEDFHFKDRSKKLMDKWQAQLNKAGASEDSAPAPAPAPETNGDVKKDDSESAPAAAAPAAEEPTAAEEKTAETEDVKMEKPTVEDKKAEGQEEEEEAAPAAPAEEEKDEPVAEKSKEKAPEQANGDVKPESDEAAPPAESS